VSNIILVGMRGGELVGVFAHNARTHWQTQSYIYMSPPCDAKCPILVVGGGGVEWVGALSHSTCTRKHTNTYTQVAYVCLSDTHIGGGRGT